MKLTIAMMTCGLVFLNGISNLRAENFTTDVVHHEESKQTSAARRSPIESHDVDTATDGNGLLESGFDRLDVNVIRQKFSSDRVDLVIKRSRHGIQVTFAPQPDQVSAGGHRHRVNSGGGVLDGPSRIYSLTGDSVTGDSVERTTVKKRDRSVTGEFGHTKRNGLFAGNFTFMPGLTSFVLSTVDLIGVVIGCYRQRRSFVV